MRHTAGVPAIPADVSCAMRASWHLRRGLPAGIAGTTMHEARLPLARGAEREVDTPIGVACWIASSSALMPHSPSS